MSPPDRQPVSETSPPPARLPAALRQDGRAPRSRAQRLLMLGILTAISLSVAIPTLIVTGIFGQRPRPKTPPAVQAAPTPDSGLLERARESANQFLPDQMALGPDPIIVPVRPAHIATRLEKVRRQAVQFGGTATDGVPDGNEKHLFVDLPATATAAFRLAVTTNATVENGSPALTTTAPSGSPAASLDHIEVIIRPAGEDE